MAIKIQYIKTNKTINVNEVKTIKKTNNNNSSITVSFRQPCTIIIIMDAKEVVKRLAS